MGRDASEWSALPLVGAARAVGWAWWMGPTDGLRQGSLLPSRLQPSPAASMTPAGAGLCSVGRPQGSGQGCHVPHRRVPQGSRDVGRLFSPEPRTMQNSL
ncbi:hypothetical protein GGTG_10162 [Gaeumannomyces tritici R3-111a-1]|uniref:Uncharacterized protein n=1 Tax=Gaeumannomyces tritici (strain R3-111a-1) TaxID=644352 RepID=J3P9I2_GAET3|nr:hypothetical protein GGTG_10162 [Gaeumannomyces tritici R3-111a-1]EJT73318.1 hypothetical protein GGTG_10162 [Gaeumannomyces tritici R3-111a-1]